MDMEVVSTIALAEAMTNPPRRIPRVDDDNETRLPSVNALVDAGYDVEFSHGWTRWETMYHGRPGSRAGD